MADNTDLDLAIAGIVADSEQSSDDDFKPSVRKVVLNQQLACNARRIPQKKQQEQQPKKRSDKREDEKGHRLVDDLSGDGGRQKKVRKQLTEKEGTPRKNATVDDSVKRSTLLSMAELDTFRYTGVGGTYALNEPVLVKENTSEYLEVAAINVNSHTMMHGPEKLGAEHLVRIMENSSDCLEVGAVNVDSETEMHFSDQLGAELLGRSGSAADHAEECVVVDIDTDEVVELGDETQFSVLLRLCGEECEQDEFRVDVPDVDRVSPVVHGSFVSAFEQPSNLVPNRRDHPGCDSMKGLVSTNLMGNVSDGSVLKEVLAQSTIDPVNNFEDTDQPVVQEGNDIEEQKSQDQICDDFISSMMTQKCVSPPEEVKAHRRIASSPLQNISNLPARVVKNNQRVNVKLINQAAKRMESKSMKNEDALDKVESGPVPGSLHQVLQLDKSSEDHCQNKENVGISPSGVIVEEHPSASGNAMERSNFCEGHESADEDFVMYSGEVRETIKCPVCGENISGISVEERLAHTNSCLDKLDTVQEGRPQEEGSRNVPESNQVKDWLEKLNLSRYLSLFVEQEIDWDTIPWLTEEDLMLMGINAIGPRRKIFQAIQELKRENSGGRTEPRNLPAAPSPAVENTSAIHIPAPPADGISRIPQGNGAESNNLITNYFPLPLDSGKNQLHEVSAPNTTVPRTGIVRNKSSRRPRSSVYQNNFGIPAWMCIPGTPFRVDAFQHLSGDCCHWFLTHFHTDHYQGLTRGFRYGHIFCSSITARLVNLRIGVSWEKLMIIPLDEKVKIAGVDVTFIDANHCPGSVMILFEPPNGEAVLHTGDFRFCPEMANNSLLQTANIRTLVLDTTYCDAQYDFPTQDTVIRFVIEAIQAEMFNSDTLFLIGTYTIGKERIFLEVGKVLKKYVYVGAPKKKLLDCMDLSADDTKWLTCNEHQSFIHVVPLWSISSFKRMDSIARHYQGRYKLIVAFSPTGWSFGRGKKKTPGKRWKRGTMIRYEVPYSEHCSFSELREFLRFISPEDIIPSVPGKDGVGADAMIASLWSEDQ